MEFSTSLKLNHIFRRLYSTSGHANTYLVLYARRNRSKENRVGLTCGKFTGSTSIALPGATTSWWWPVPPPWMRILPCWSAPT